MSYRCVIVGCGPRAEKHANVYREISETDLVAACDKDRKRLIAFGKRHNIQNLYENYSQMLERQRPDIVNVATQPTFRVVPVEIAANYGVKAVILEKPVVVMPSEAEQLCKICQRKNIKVIVNMQRRYDKGIQNLKALLSSGKIGNIEFVRCMTMANMMRMGPHLMDLLLMCLGDICPVSVVATVYGAEDLTPPPGVPPAPANFIANYIFPNGISVFFEAAKDTVGTRGENKFWRHLELDFWGTEGRAWWTQCRGSGYQSSGMITPEIYPTNVDTDEPIQQAEFIRTLVRWLNDNSVLHANRLENALCGFDALMAGVKSALLNSRLSLPTEVTDEEVCEMWERLRKREETFCSRRMR